MGLCYGLGLNYPERLVLEHLIPSWWRCPGMF